MNILRITFYCSAILIAFSCQSTLFSKPVKSGDYFESGPQRKLAEASARGRIKEIRRLLDEGSKINFRGNEGMTALIWTLIQQNKRGYQYLLENGADPNLQMTESTLTDDGLTHGNSAISLAAMHEDPWYLEITLKHGGNPNLVNPVKGVPPLFQCITLLDRRTPKPGLERLKLLIAAHANLNAQDNNGNTPMIAAAIANRYDMVYIILENGADPTIKRKAGNAIVSVIKLMRTDPNSGMYQWKSKVIDLLKAKGIDVENGR